MALPGSGVISAALPATVELRRIRVVAAPGVTHLTYAVGR